MWTLIPLGVVLLVAGGTAAWIVPRALDAKGELEAAIPLAASVQADLLSGDTATAGKSAQQMAKHTAAGRELTGDAVWSSLEVLPWVGENLRAVRLAAVAADELAVKVVIPAASIDIDSFKPIDGRFDVEAIAALGPLVDGIAETISSEQKRLTVIDRTRLVSQVAAGVEKLDSALDEVEGALGGVQDAVHLLPAALGADGPRNYLMLFETNAETRGTGGLPGVFLLVNVTDGVLSVANQSPAKDFLPGLAEPIIDLDAETEALYGSKIARYVGDITLTPDFPYTAQLGQAFWTRTHGGTVDGVLSFDPVALGYLLGATGPVTLPSGTELNSENAAPLLLNESYFLFPDYEDQDIFFGEAASSIFDAVESGRGDTMSLINAIVRSIDERRLNLWSADLVEQAVIAETSMAGILPGNNLDATVLGVYFNDDSAGKMEYYLDTSVEVEAAQCTAEPPTLRSTVSLTSHVPLDAATSLPSYVYGSWYTPGHIMMDLVVYGPVGGELMNFSVDGEPATPLYNGRHLARPASKVRFGIAPRQTVIVEYETSAPLWQSRPVEVRHTPMFRPVDVSISEPEC